MIYILGTERSAGTWVANILDHHSHVDVYMEPLSSFTSRFSTWPGRFTKLQNLEDKAEEFKSEFDILISHSRFLFTRLSTSSSAWNKDLNLAEWMIKKNLAWDSIVDFLELNFHRKNRQIDVVKSKSSTPLIKEVRLNFNAKLVKKIDPDVRVLVPIREMASTVQSIMRFLEKGHLIDLKNDLLNEFRSTDVQTISAYWYKSYASLLETLNENKIPYHIISHMDLLQHTVETVENMFHFLSLSIQPEIEQYLMLSDKSGEGKHITSRSKNQLLEQIEKDRKLIHPFIENQIEIIHNHPILKKYAGGE